MRKALLGSIAAMASVSGWAAGQSPRLPSAIVPAPVAVAPSGVMPASFNMPANMPIPDAGMMSPAGMGMPGMPGGMAPGGMGPGGMMPEGPFPTDAGPGMGMPMGGGGYGGGGPEVDNGSSLAPKFELHAKYLLYFVNAQPTPGPLVTTGAPGSGGFIGGPSTLVLHGQEEFGMGLFSGFDINGILWKDPDRRLGLQIGGMMLERKSNSFSAASDSTGQPLYARPFTNAITGGQDALLVSFPNAITGGVRSEATTHLWGGEGNLVWNLYRSCPGDWCSITSNWITGFRYYQLNEQINIDQSSTLINGATAVFDQKIYQAPARIGVRDQIQTLNQFYGGQVGISVDARYGRVFIGMAGKVGIGVMHQRLNVAGFSSITDPITGANSVLRGGLLANAANIGRTNNDEFALIPEASATLGYNWSSWFTTTVGYSFLYMNNVIRPGNQVSTTINPALVPAHPAFGGGFVPVTVPTFKETQFWAQGVQFGFIFRW